MFSAPAAGASTINCRRCSPAMTTSDIESHVDDVAVAHHVVAALQPLLAAFAQHRVGTRVEQLLGAGHLGADETARDVGVDARRGVEGGLALAEVPGAHLGIARGEER